MRNMTKMLCLSVLGLSLMTLTGCGRVTAGDIRGNMTPELKTTNRSSGIQKNDYARIIDNNTRGAWDDLDRFLLLHRNSRLSPWPMP